MPSAPRLLAPGACIGMNKVVLFFALAMGLTACNDDESYPGCDSTWWWACDFRVSSWNLGSSNYWIYGSNPTAYFYYDGSIIGIETVSIPRAKADNCATFVRDDVLTWDGCENRLTFNCDFIVNAKIVYNRYSSNTAGKDDKYPTVPGTEFEYDCSR